MIGIKEGPAGSAFYPLFQVTIFFEVIMLICLAKLHGRQEGALPSHFQITPLRRAFSLRVKFSPPPLQLCP